MLVVLFSSAAAGAEVFTFRLGGRVVSGVCRDDTNRLCATACWFVGGRVATAPCRKGCNDSATNADLNGLKRVSASIHCGANLVAAAAGGCDANTTNSR